MTSTSASRRAITTDACRTNNTTDSTRRFARSSRVPALRSWKPPGCPSFQLGTTCLYCHPTELSGPVEEPHIALVERILRQGTSFQYQTTDRYDRLYDFTIEEELAYYRQHYSEQLFLEAFRTSDPSKYHLRDEVLEELVRQLMVHTVLAPLGCSFDSPCVHFVRETYTSLVQRGLLVEVQRRKPYGTMTYCRTK